jgi:hypothetical protein
MSNLYVFLTKITRIHSEYAIHESFNFGTSFEQTNDLRNKVLTGF